MNADRERHIHLKFIQYRFPDKNNCSNGKNLIKTAFWRYHYDMMYVGTKSKKFCLTKPNREMS